MTGIKDLYVFKFDSVRSVLCLIVIMVCGNKYNAHFSIKTRDAAWCMKKTQIDGDSVQARAWFVGCLFQC